MILGNSRLGGDWCPSEVTRPTSSGEDQGRNAAVASFTQPNQTGGLMEGHMVKALWAPACLKSCSKTVVCTTAPFFPWEPEAI